MPDYLTIYIPDEIEAIVDSMRDTETITNIIDNSNNTYTISATDIQNIAINDYIQITGSGAVNDDNLRVTAIDSSLNTFTISLTSGKTISTFGTWKANSPYFAFGYSKDVQKILLERGKSPKFARQRFPLIWLALGYDIDRTKKYPSWGEVNLFIAFIKDTTLNANTADSYKNNIKGVLYPIYERFMDELQKNISDFIVESGESINFPHSLHEYVYYNHEDEGQDKNEFSTPVDAIVIDSLKLNFKNKINC
jgi:hypothetical protein